MLTEIIESSVAEWFQICGHFSRFLLYSLMFWAGFHYHLVQLMVNLIQNLSCKIIQKIGQLLSGILKAE